MKQKSVIKHQKTRKYLMCFGVLTTIGIGSGVAITVTNENNKEFSGHESTTNMAQAREVFAKSYLNSSLGLKLQAKMMGHMSLNSKTNWQQTLDSKNVWKKFQDSLTANPDLIQPFLNAHHLKVADLLSWFDEKKIKIEKRSEQPAELGTTKRIRPYEVSNFLIPFKGSQSVWKIPFLNYRTASDSELLTALGEEIRQKSPLGTTRALDKIVAIDSLKELSKIANALQRAKKNLKPLWLDDIQDTYDRAVLTTATEIKNQLLAKMRTTFKRLNDYQVEYANATKIADLSKITVTFNNEKRITEYILKGLNAVGPENFADWSTSSSQYKDRLSNRGKRFEAWKIPLNLDPQTKVFNWTYTDLGGQVSAPQEIGWNALHAQSITLYHPEDRVKVELATSIKKLKATWTSDYIANSQHFAEAIFTKLQTTIREVEKTNHVFLKFVIDPQYVTSAKELVLDDKTDISIFITKFKNLSTFLKKSSHAREQDLEVKGKFYESSDKSVRGHLINVTPPQFKIINHIALEHMMKQLIGFNEISTKMTVVSKSDLSLAQGKVWHEFLKVWNNSKNKKLEEAIHKFESSIPLTIGTKDKKILKTKPIVVYKKTAIIRITINDVQAFLLEINVK